MTQRTLRQIAMAGASLAMLTAFAAPARAQNAPAAPVKTQNEATALEEVVVTAQRREESLQSVPVSVTAITGAQLQQRQITDISAITRSAPNMAVGPAYDPTDIVVAVRGISETIPQLGVDPSVGIYIDEVYYAITPGANAAFIDMERVEVLRGPQGTLFGRNTIGGALNITTAKPTGEFGGSVTAGVGNYDGRTFTGVLNLPIVGDKVAARIVFDHQEHGGYSYNAFLNQPLDDAKQDYVRATVALRPNDAWEIMLSGDYFKFDGSSRLQKIAYYNANDGGLNAFIPLLNGHPGDLLTNYATGGFHTGYGNINPPTSIEKYGFTAHVTGKLNEDVTFKSVTGYTKLDRTEGTDNDGTPYAALDLTAAPLNARQFSEELQLFGDLMGSRLKWIVGAYYFDMKGFQDYTVNLFEPLLFQNVLDESVKNRSYAAFAQATYEILPKLRVTAGVRYTKDNRESVNFNHLNTYAGQYSGCNLPLVTPALTQAQCFLAGKVSFSYWPWTVGLDYAPTEDTMVYAKVSKGYRSGGFPQSPETFPLTTTLKAFQPENDLSYEVGAKLELFDRRFRFNSALFYTTYDKIQQSFNVPSAVGPLTVVRNVGEARYYGAEFEATALIEKLRLNAAVGLIDPKFTAGPLVDPIRYPVTNVSKTTVSLDASYPIDVGFGVVTLTGDYNWRSKIYYFEPILGPAALLISDPAAQNAGVAQKAFGLLDASASLKLANYPVTLTVWGRNLTDKDYKARVTGLVEGGLPFDAYIPGDPRTYGVSLKWEF